MDLSIRQNSNSAPINLMPNQAKFTHWRSPGLSEIQLHYGHANDPKDYRFMTHGMPSDDKSFVRYFNLKRSVLHQNEFFI